VAGAVRRVARGSRAHPLVGLRQASGCVSSGRPCPRAMRAGAVRCKKTARAASLSTRAWPTTTPPSTKAPRQLRRAARSTRFAA
jgi:hypothetical protein